MHEFPDGSDPLAVRLFAAFLPLLKGSQNEVMSITAEFELTMSQMRMLFVLEHSDRPLAVNELAERVALSMAAAGRAVDHLHRNGIVSRREDAADRRIKRIELTPLGSTAIAQIGEARLHATERFVESLSVDERTELDAAVTTLGRLTARTLFLPLPAGCAHIAGRHHCCQGDLSMSSPTNTPQPAGPDGSGYAFTTEKIDARLIAIAAVVVIGTFMSILDTTIVNVAINTLSEDFNSSLATIQWVSTGYMLALATVIPLTGWAADRFGTKRLYITSISLFLAGSALSGFAWSANSLIFFRILQGLGGGMIMPAGMTILTQAAGPKRMGRMMGIVGVPMLLGPILGPIIGGALVDSASWRWIFFVNIPIGAVALVMAYRILDTDKPKPAHPLDWVGLLLLSPGLGLFVYGLAEIASSGGFGSPKTLLGVVGGLLLVIAFIRHANRREGALIDVNLFQRRTVGAAAGTTFLFGTAFFGTMFLMPLYLQLVRGQSAFDSGLLLAAQGIGAMITMPIAGKMTDKTGAGRIVLVGLVFISLGMLSLSQITSTTSWAWIEFTLFLNGLGMGATMMPAMSSALSSVKRHEVPRATSGLNVIQRVGGSIGTALLAVVFTHQMTNLLGGSGAGTGGESGLSAIQNLPVAAQAQVLPLVGDAFGNTFLWSLGIILLAFIPAYFLPRHLPPADTTATEAEKLERREALLAE